VVLVGHSAGCYDVYAYLRAFGVDNVRASVFVDETPRPVAARKGDWAVFADMTEAGDFVRAVIYDFRGLIRGILPPMMKREMRPDELDWASDQLLMTPNYAAALLIADFLFSDYTAEARMIDGKIPVLNVVNEDWAQAARTWLKENASHAEVVALGKHLMLLEFPEQFNAAVDAFLERVG
jgi:pimeloyl-ACP methyl ester carboxylesterase